jgi:nitroreductase
MQTWDAIGARRNVRQYSGEPIAAEDLERICEAGRRAPSAGNWQPWDFVVVTGREELAELAKVWDRAGGTSPPRRRRSLWWPRSPGMSGRATGSFR